MQTRYSEDGWPSAGEASDLEDDEFIESRPPAKRELNLLTWALSGGPGQCGQMFEWTLQCLPVFKDFFFVIRPATTWNRLAAARHGVGFTFAYYLLPMLLLTAMAEGGGLILLGRQQAAEGMHNRFTLPMVCVYEAGSLLLLLGFVVLAAIFIRSFANACHARNHLSESLLLMLHCVGPLLLIQWFNGFPHIYHWLTWLTGAALALVALYHGLPKIMKPDVPSAMGLFVASAITMLLLMLCWRILTGFYLAGDLKPVEMFFSSLVASSAP